MQSKTRFVPYLLPVSLFAIACSSSSPSEKGDASGPSSGGADPTGGGGSAQGGDPSGGTGGRNEEPLGGAGGVREQPAPSCEDEVRNQGETDVDCGGDHCAPCVDSLHCDEAEDCQSGVCEEGACAPAECGDGVTNGSEECDAGSEPSATCDTDCTVAECGDGEVNELAGEVCERAESAPVYTRCNEKCGWGTLLAGTWPASIPNQPSPWTELSGGALSSSTRPGLQSYLYAGQSVIYDLTQRVRYSLVDDVWTDLSVGNPYTIQLGESGAVSGNLIYVPRNSAVHWFSIDSETWNEAGAISGRVTPPPDGSLPATAAVFDGEGHIWYLSTSYTLVKYDPSDGSHQSFDYLSQFPGFDTAKTRFAYDPISNRVGFGGAGSSTLLIFEIETGVLTQSATNPGGAIGTNSCQDRAGGMFVGSSTDLTQMYRYDFAANTFAPLPPLPLPHDQQSTCVVHETGALYVPLYESAMTQSRLYRLQLDVK